MNFSPQPTLRQICVSCGSTLVGSEGCPGWLVSLAISRVSVAEATVSALAAWFEQKKPDRHRLQSSLFALAELDEGLGSLVSTCVSSFVGLTPAESRAVTFAVAGFGGLRCVCLPVAHPAISMKSEKSWLFRPQHVQLLFPSWNRGAPGWYRQHPGGFVAAGSRGSYTASHPMRWHVYMPSGRVEAGSGSGSRASSAIVKPAGRSPPPRASS